MIIEGESIELVGFCFIQSRVPQFHRGIWFIASNDRIGWSWMWHLVCCCKRWDGQGWGESIGLDEVRQLKIQ